MDRNKELFTAIMTQNLLLERLYRKITDQPVDDTAAMRHVEFLFFKVKDFVEDRKLFE